MKGKYKKIIITQFTLFDLLLRLQKQFGKYFGLDSSSNC